MHVAVVASIHQVNDSRIAHLRCRLVLLVLLTIVKPIFAQSDIPNPYNYGTPVNAEFSGGAIDSINLATGGLHIDIPLLDLPGIGQDTHIHYIYDNLVWNQTAATQPNGQYWITLYQDRPLWKFQDPMQAGVTVRTHVQSYSSCPSCGTGQAEYIDYVSFEDENGTSHQFPINGFPQSVPVGGTIPNQAYSLDSSGYLVNINNLGTVTSVIDKHGTKYIFNYNPASLVVQNANGNRITGTYTSPNQQGQWTETLTDTVDRTITSIWNSYGDATGGYGPRGSVQSLSYTDQNGNTQTITVNFVPVQINLALACQGNTGTCGPLVGLGAGTATAQLPGSIVLQNGDTYTIQYEPNGLGEISSITLPTGGVIGYTWSSTASQSGRTVLTRTVTVGSQSSTWKFSVNSRNQIVVTDPNLNDTAYTCTNYTPNPQGFSPAACYMTEEDFYSGSSSGTPIATKKTTYTITGSVMPTATTFEWNQTGQVTETDTNWEHIPNSGFNCNGCTDNPAEDVSRGNKLSEVVYGYGTGSHGPLLKNIQYNYLHLQNSSYLGQNIADRLSQESIYNCATLSSSCLIAQTTTGYDQFNQNSVDGQGGLSATSGTTQHDYTNYSTNQTMRGLATSVSKYVGPSSSAIVTYTNYNDLGNPTVTTDGFDTTAHSTAYIYGSQNAFVSTIALPSTGSQHRLGKLYDINTGLLISETDQNNQTTSYTYDSRMRPLTIKRPDGGSTTNSYPDADHVNTTVTQTSSSSQTSTVVLDGLGRTIQTRLTSDPSGTDLTDITYDPLGRKQSVSNPYRSTSDPTYGITSYLYDVLGRVIDQCEQDNTSSPSTTCVPTNSYLKWVYTGNVTDFYDETGRHWQRTNDALGRLTKVLEPDGSINLSANPSVETDYQYDALNNLTSVYQHGLVRNFAYDGLSRLITASNPETGTICYGLWSSGQCAESYDANGNLTARTDNRGIDTTYTYDALNRLTSKTYSDGTPTAHFNYDETSVTVGSNFWGGPHPIANGIGRMTSWYVGPSEPGVAMKSFSYDAMGRPVSSWQCWASECSITYGTRQTGRIYDLAGNVTAVGNGQDSQVDYTYDGAGRVNSAVYWYQNNSPKLTVPLVASETYTAFGQPATRNGNETWSYDKRLRVTSYTNKSSPNSSIVNYGYQLSYQPNGNLNASTETSGSKWWTWAYYYDNLNRVHTAVSPQLSEGCFESYDTYGNRTSQQPYGGSGYSCGSFTASYTGNNNRIDGYCYDASGNLLDAGPCPTNGNHQFTYDGEERIATAMHGNIVNTYGADGLRASTGVAGQTPTDFLYDYDGSILAHQISGAYGPQEIWVNGKHFGFINLVGSPVSAVLTQSIPDWLGTERARADAAGNLQATFCNLPFGDQLTTCFGTDPNPADVTHFTGKERDNATDDVNGVNGLDYFGARHYSSSMGRFVSPDPTGGSLLNPQTLNKYTYGLNNPLVNTDPTGLDCIHINNDTGAYEGFESGDCNNSTPELANTGQYVNGTVSQIQLNQQGQVLGYSGADENGSSIGDSFMSAGNGVVYGFNPYSGSLSGSEFGQTVNVFGNASSGSDTSLVSISAQIPANGLQPASNMAVIRAVPPTRQMTPAEIRSWCKVAAMLGNGATVPGSVAPSVPSEDTPATNMLVPSQNARYPGETREMEVRPMDPTSGDVGNLGGGLATLATYAACIDAVSR